MTVSITRPEDVLDVEVKNSTLWPRLQAICHAERGPYDLGCLGPDSVGEPVCGDYNPDHHAPTRRLLPI
jgi:hypothetical protein